MTNLTLYNSLTRKLESFAPRNGNKVQMFVCGPTVWDLVHLGNARTFVLFDVVAKWLRYIGYKVDYVQNITDIDDKIIKRASEQSRDSMEYAAEYTEKFIADMTALGVTTPRYEPATKYIDRITAQVKTLIAKDNVYFIAGDGWYFDLTTFPDYGKLSGRTGLAANDAVSRIDDSEKKRNTGDFCVWKLKKDGEPSWPDDELGEGRPGWHIEDTAVTEANFGPQYDLHGGGMDLKFPHHEAEIAQQEAASGKVPFVRYWMHTGFLENTSEKMSKSLGNFLTLRDALVTYEPAVLRLYLLSNHYRAPLDFSDIALDTARAAVERIRNIRARLFFAETEKKLPAESPDTQASEAVKKARAKMTEGMNDDFNTAIAFAGLFEYIKELNRLLRDDLVSITDAHEAEELFSFAADIFGIIPFGGTALPERVEQLLTEREIARQAKDWAASDDIRDQLAHIGYTVDDTPYGPLVKKK